MADRKSISAPEDFGPGMKSDGTVTTLTPEEAAIARAARDTDETTFSEVYDAEDDGLDDLDEIDKDVIDA